jgi:hypothetical protein
MKNKKATMVAMATLSLVALVFVYVFIFQKQEKQKTDSSTSGTVAQKELQIKDDIASRTQCFQGLKDNMVEAGIFSEPLQEIEKMTYADLATKFSRNYKNLSSFGLDINQSNFEMRVYSFGRQTGYIHPPLSPFPISTKADLWEEPAKEFIIAEEYVNEPGKGIHFIDCAFIQIATEDPTKVTRENYLYDGAMISLNKTAKDNSYKSWYGENVSFNYDGKPFVTWKRIFVYPQSSQNDYFDKYTVAEAYPANKVESFDVLNFFKQSLIKLQDYDEEGHLIGVKTVTFDENGEQVEIIMPDELQPIKADGINKIFPLAEYYQAIEARFPEFAKRLSVRGSLQYETFKKLIIEKQEPEIVKLINNLLDYRQLMIYATKKIENEKQGMVVTDPEMDKLLMDVADVDTAIQNLSQKEIRVDNDLNNQNRTKVGSLKPYAVIISLSFLSILIFGGIIIWKKHNKLNNLK